MKRIHNFFQQYFHDKKRVHKALIVLTALILSMIFVTTLIPQPKIAIIKINQSIYGDGYPELRSMMIESYFNDSIKGVILEIDTTGGEAYYSEEIYFDLLKIKTKKPIAAVIGAKGTSGAYYVALAANKIFAKPSSVVGNVGVVSTLPEKKDLDEGTVITGPYKKMGESKTDHTRYVQAIRELFLRAIMTQRGDKLRISKSMLGEAKVYGGVEALHLGLVDELGGTIEAIEYVANTAGVHNYQIVNLHDHMIDQNKSLTLEFDQNAFVNTGMLPNTYYYPLGG